MRWSLLHYIAFSPLSKSVHDIYGDLFWGSLFCFIYLFVYSLKKKCHLDYCNFTVSTDARQCQPFILFNIVIFIMGLLPLLVYLVENCNWNRESILPCTPVWLSLSYRRGPKQFSQSRIFFLPSLPPSLASPSSFLPSSLIEFFFLLQTLS